MDGGERCRSLWQPFLHFYLCHNPPQPRPDPFFSFTLTPFVRLRNSEHTIHLRDSSLEEEYLSGSGFIRLRCLLTLERSMSHVYDCGASGNPQAMTLYFFPLAGEMGARWLSSFLAYVSHLRPRKYQGTVGKHDTVDSVTADSKSQKRELQLKCHF